jgi:hypothetical protein
MTRSPCPDPLRAELRVFSPHQPVRFISARLSSQIQALQVLWPNAPKRFVFKGLELIETNTFNDYGVREGDSIIALSQEDSSSLDN